MKFNRLFLIFWIALAYTLCLMPGPYVLDEGIGRWNKRSSMRDAGSSTGKEISDSQGRQDARDTAGRADSPSAPLDPQSDLDTSLDLNSTTSSTISSSSAVADPPIETEKLNRETRASPENESAALNAVNALLTENVKPKERLGHIIPMIGVAFCLTRLLQRKSESRRQESVNSDQRESLKTDNLKRKTTILLLTLLFVFSIALSIELLQELVPEWFHRGFAWDDIGMALLGGLTGGIFASVLERATRLPDRRS